MEHLFNLNDKVAIVTGAGHGIGRAIALTLAAHGAKVCVNDININAAKKTATAIIETGGTAIPYHAAIDKKVMTQTMFHEIIEAWGKVDILVNNAGIEPKSPLLAQGEWEWVRTFDINTKGTFLCTQIGGRVMREVGGGVILNIGGSPAYPPDASEYAAVSASKAAVVQFTRDTARDFAPYNIRVNGICPGFIKTTLTKDLWETGNFKWGEPQDVATMALFLCSDAARFVNGQFICVDGGQ